MVRPLSLANRSIWGRNWAGTLMQKVRVVRVRAESICSPSILRNNIFRMAPESNPSKPKKYVSLSFTAPLELEEPMNEAAGARGMSRSQYICWLVQQDMYAQSRSPTVPLLASPRVPPRIRRKKKAGTGK
jgi:hypothetical protein